MRLRQAALRLFLLAAIVVGVQSIEANEPPKATSIEVLPVAPRDMRRLFDTSAIVARVKIISSTPVIVERSGNLGPTLRTKYASAVIDTYKGSDFQHLEFYQTAGAVRNERYDIRVEGQTVLVPGREYVVFLAPYAFFHSYALTGEDNGAFEIRNSRMKALGASELSRTHDNMAIERFVAELRRVGGKVAR